IDFGAAGRNRYSAWTVPGPLRMAQALRLPTMTWTRPPRRAGASAALVLALAGAREGEAGVDRWTLLGPAGGRSLALAFDPADPAVLYLAGDGGLWKSADAGGEWWRLSPHGGGDGSAVAVDPFDRRIVYSASFDGLERSLDGGVGWT